MATREILLVFFLKGRVWCTSDNKQGNQMLNRESDSSVVPMKLGNADGGKASYQLSPLIGTHLLHSEVGIMMETKLLRIAEM
jgi:hypothetical protein